MKDHILKLQRKIRRYDWSSQLKLKPWKNSGLDRIWTHDLCDTSAVLYKLSYQANWEPITWWGGNIHLRVYCTAPVSQRSSVRIPVRAWIFSGVYRTLLKVVCVTAMIICFFILVFCVRRFRATHKPFTPDCNHEVRPPRVDLPSEALYNAYIHAGKNGCFWPSPVSIEVYRKYVSKNYQ